MSRRWLGSWSRAGRGAGADAHAPDSAGRAVSPRVAIRAALPVRPRVARCWPVRTGTASVASPIDAELERVDFYAGEPDPGRGGASTRTATSRRSIELQPQNGRAVRRLDRLSAGAAVGLCILFVLVMAGSRGGGCATSTRLAALSLVVSVVLFQHRYLDPSVLAAAPGLALPARSGALARRSARRRGPAPSTPLLAALAPGGIDARARRVRWLRVAVRRARARVRDGRRELARTPWT